MKAGTLYEADTLDEIWPTARPFGEYHWVDPDMLRNDDRPTDFHDRPRRPGGS